MSLKTPYSPLKRYPLPYGKPWYPSEHHGYTRGRYPAGCGREPDIGPITEQQQWMRDSIDVWKLMVNVYHEADKDWPWIDTTPKQLDLFT